MRARCNLASALGVEYPSQWLPTNFSSLHGSKETLQISLRTKPIQCHNFKWDLLYDYRHLQSFAEHQSWITKSFCPNPSFGLWSFPHTHNPATLWALKKAWARRFMVWYDKASYRGNHMTDNFKNLILYASWLQAPKQAACNIPIR